MRQRMLRSVSPGRVLSTMLDAKQFAENLPARVNRRAAHAGADDLPPARLPGAGDDPVHHRRRRGTLLALQIISHDRTSRPKRPQGT